MRPSPDLRVAFFMTEGFRVWGSEGILISMQSRAPQMEEKICSIVQYIHIIYIYMYIHTYTYIESCLRDTYIYIHMYSLIL